MPKIVSELSKSQVGKIRANMARKATQLGNRLMEYALDYNETVKMTATQVNAAKVVLGHVLPAQASTEFSDVTEPEISMQEQERQYQDAIAQLPVHDLRHVLASMPSEERQALIDSMEETSQ